METNRPDYTETLTRHGIRPTAVRLLIYKTALRFHDTFSMSELEDALESVDKSTVFRTLSLFAARHLLHEIEDGSGSTKYCICRNDRPCGIDELHCHFHCEACRKTFCLDYTHIPAVRYPAGFEVRQIDYLLKGLCPDCRAKRHVGPRPSAAARFATRLQEFPAIFASGNRHRLPAPSAPTDSTKRSGIRKNR